MISFFWILAIIVLTAVAVALKFELFPPYYKCMQGKDGKCTEKCDFCKKYL